MMDEEAIIKELLVFKNENQFSDEKWIARGLRPSDVEVCKKLKNLFDYTVDQLIFVLNNQGSKRKIKRILKFCLSNFKQIEFDTEEREFIVDLFSSLAKILNISFADNLNKWLYGYLIFLLIKTKSLLSPDRVVETTTQSCSKCTNNLETFIMKKEIGIPDYEWLIVTCNNCKEFNLLSLGPNRKETRYGNYTVVEQLPKEEFNEEDALMRLEQIKLFRKR